MYTRQFTLLAHKDEESSSRMMQARSRRVRAQHWCKFSYAIFRICENPRPSSYYYLSLSLSPFRSTGATCRRNFLNVVWKGTNRTGSTRASSTRDCLTLRFEVWQFEVISRFCSLILCLCAARTACRQTRLHHIVNIVLLRHICPNFARIVNLEKTFNNIAILLISRRLIHTHTDCWIFVFWLTQDKIIVYIEREMLLVYARFASDCDSRHHHRRE